jgi:hypothetical protein
MERKAVTTVALAHPWQRRLVAVAWYFFVAWGLFFVYYMFDTFFVRPVSTWVSVSAPPVTATHESSNLPPSRMRRAQDTVEEFHTGLRPLFMGLHWAGGCVVLLLGPLQFVTTLRQRWPLFHRALGYIYATSAFTTVLAGSVYMTLYGTVGGPAMTVPFAVYGALFALSAVLTVLRAMRHDFRSHSEWALRLYSLGIASAVYRVLVSPIFLDDSFPLSHEDKMLWLVIASYFFYVPNLVLAELWIRFVWRPARAAKLQDGNSDAKSGPANVFATP